MADFVLGNGNSSSAEDIKERKRRERNEKKRRERQEKKKEKQEKQESGCKSSPLTTPPLPSSSLLLKWSDEDSGQCLADSVPIKPPRQRRAKRNTTSAAVEPKDEVDDKGAGKRYLAKLHRLTKAAEKDAKLWAQRRRQWEQEVAAENQRWIAEKRAEWEREREDANRKRLQQEWVEWKQSTGDWLDIGSQWLVFSSVYNDQLKAEALEGEAIARPRWEERKRLLVEERLECKEAWDKHAAVWEAIEDRRRQAWEQHKLVIQMSLLTLQDDEEDAPGFDETRAYQSFLSSESEVMRKEDEEYQRKTTEIAAELLRLQAKRLEKFNALSAASSKAEADIVMSFSASASEDAEEVISQ